jgi:hypothetical protein
VIPKTVLSNLMLFLTAALLAAVWMPGTLLPAERSRAETTTRMQIESYYTAVIDDETDLEALARIAAYAAHLSNGDEARFMRLMNGLILDAPAHRGANRLAVLTGPWCRVRQRLHARWSWVPGSPAPGRFGDTGFAAQDGGNQVLHMWYSTAVAYSWGARLADWSAWYHEWNAPGVLRHLPGTGGGHGTAIDLVLSRQGIALGRALAEGRLSPEQVPDWLRQRLGAG